MLLFDKILKVAVALFAANASRRSRVIPNLVLLLHIENEVKGSLPLLYICRSCVPKINVRFRLKIFTTPLTLKILMF